ncbi:carbamate kinase [Amphibacillus sp. MSJ-3]|uniref:carbamate kinase n=1 Tax=Amphibacillus sp. MSJ-3 TaxID=2841505 RepID=UPI001C0EAF6A|nr:carbamate kinase [Amphibacillus sp. MSJ-3]MBU5595717.1 carbamate kinase [Amphibacillus sp. MSJ-3]
MAKKIVVALGGNAILTDNASAESQQIAIKQTAERLVPLIEQGNELIISHGNGPQVGNLLLQQIATDSPENPALPLDTCVAMTQGSIGYWLQQAMREALKKRGIEKEVVTVLTQIVVDKDDPAFLHPTKPIGPFLTEEVKNQQSNKDTFIEDAGRGWRKVVASPKPIHISEAPLIKKLVHSGVITIAAGGGGIPITINNGQIEGVEAVIDKDLASEKLAELVDADAFIILTSVDHVFINYNQANQRKLTHVTVEELEQYIKENQFAPGSMLPKVEAAIEFVNFSQKDKQTIITSLDHVEDLFTGKIGTYIH